MNEQVMENLSEVRAEARSMLDTLRAVKGDKHAHIVRSLLMCTQGVELTSVVLRGTDMPPETADQVGHAFLHVLHGIVTGMALAGGISESEINAAIDDASRIGDSVDSLTRAAVDHGVSGGEFGGKTAS